MTIESELQAQLDFLRRPDTVWVQRGPSRPGEACLVVRLDEKEIVVLSSPAYCWLCDQIGSGLAPTDLNDRFAAGRDEVVERLEKAVAAAGEQGIYGIARSARCAL